MFCHLLVFLRAEGGEPAHEQDEYDAAYDGFDPFTHDAHQPSTIAPISPTMTKSETKEIRKTIAVMIETPIKNVMAVGSVGECFLKN